MKPDKLAIDIVLVPPVEIIAEAVRINQMLGGEVNKIALNESACVPHITLSMGVVDRMHIPEIMKGLQNMAADHYNLNLEFSNAYRAPLETGEVISGVNIVKTDALNQLHLDAMELLKPYQLNEYDNNVLVEGENADPITLDFIRLFPVKASYNNFNPHMTLIFGELFETGLHGTRFSCDTLALYHLGSYCTCKDLIDSHRMLHR
jgi:hypothetical protein